MGLLLVPGVSAQQPPGRGLHYFAVENLATHEIEQRGTGASLGDLLLAPETEYRAWILQADTLLIARTEFRTGLPGRTSRLPALVLRPHNTLDADQDGLPDVAEFIVGTDVKNPDTDGDGLADGAEVRQGLDPLDGLIGRTGIIASVNTPGDAVDICAFNDVAIVADSSAGITVFNVFNGLAPIRIAQIDTPGSARAVSCTGEFIAVADGVAGLAVVDFREPSRARIARQLSLGQTREVATAGPLAYVVADSDVVLVDMPSGAVLDRRGYSPDPVDDLVVAGDAVYVLAVIPGTAGRHTVFKIPVGPGLEIPAAIVEVSGRDHPTFGRMHIAAGGGLVHVGSADESATRQIPGIEVFVDLGDELDLIGPPSPITAFDVALNGSGLALYTGATPGATRGVGVLDIRDPTTTDRIVGAFDTPGSAQAVSVYNGLVYVVDRGGLRVIAYQPYEVNGAPPEVALSFSFADNPPRAEEGKLVRVAAEVEDDVQVRNVEFYVDGRKAATDGNFPFEHRFVTPRLSEQSSFTLRARAFDTAGQSTFTDEILVDLVEDATPPQVLRTVPFNGTFSFAVDSVGAFFSEPIVAASLTDATFVLMEAGADRAFETADDRTVAGGLIEYRDENASAFRSFTAGLAPGIYRASLDGSVSDLKGNRLEDEVRWSFAVFGADTDTDGDGLPDLVETFLSLDPDLDFDPLDPDTDGDGIADGEEDIDGDGAPSAAEIALGFSPTDPDTDRDLILDGDEDSDFDLLADVRELELGTDRFRRDSDSDGFIDGDEVSDGSDPLDAQSIPVRDLLGGLALENLAPPPVRTTSAQASLRNTIAPAAAAGAVEGRAISVENRSEP